jgi:hypothetical protein
MGWRACVADTALITRRIDLGAELVAGRPPTLAPPQPVLGWNSLLPRSWPKAPPAPWPAHHQRRAPCESDISVSWNLYRFTLTEQH